MPDPGPILLLTRPAAAAARFLAAVRAAGAGARAIISPLIELEFLVPDLPEIAVSGLILTSENGATGAGRLGLAAGTRAFCVGDQTARAARRAGFQAISAGGDADALVALILARAEVGPLLHLRGEHARGDVATRLSALGVPTRDITAYRQNRLPLTPDAQLALAGEEGIVAPLFSPRTASIMADSGPFRAPLTVVAISAAVADASAALAPRDVILAPRSDGVAMLRATIAALQCGPVLETGVTEG